MELPVELLLPTGEVYLQAWERQEGCVQVACEPRRDAGSDGHAEWQRMELLHCICEGYAAACEMCLLTPAINEMGNTDKEARSASARLCTTTSRALAKVHLCVVAIVSASCIPRHCGKHRRLLAQSQCPIFARMSMLL